MIEFKTKLSKDEVLALNKFQLYKNMRVFCIIASVIFTIMGIVMFITGEGIGDKVFSVIFILIFGIGFTPFCFLVTKLIMHFQLKTNKIISEDNLVHVILRDEDVYVENEKEDLSSKMTMKWSLVYRVYQTKDHFFIYISNMQSYVLPICDMVEGSVEELHTMLETKLGKKFKVK